METLQKATSVVRQLTESALAVLALAVVLQVLLGAATQPFLPVDVVGNVVTLTKQLGSEGLVGLVAVWVLVTLLNRNSE